MELFLLLTRTALAVLFATASVAKFADLKGSEKAFKDFGAPAAVALPSSIALSVFELVIAVFLLFPQTSWYAAIAAAALLTLFITQMIYLRVKGSAPDCHCFGQLHSEPVSLKSILRNVVFLVVLLIPLFQGPARQGLSLQEITSAMMPTILCSLLVVMMAGALLYLKKVIANQNEIKRRLDLLQLLGHDGEAKDHEHFTDPEQGLPIGSPLSVFQMPDLAGTTVSLGELLSAGKPLLFFFVAPTCEPCQALLSEFTQWGDNLAEKVTSIFITSGSVEENRKKFAHLDETRVLIDSGREFALSVGGRWTPTALYVDSQGKIASHVAAGDIAIEELVEKIKQTELTKPFTFFASGGHHGRGLKIGKEIPDFSLTDIHGRELTRHDLLGKRTLVTFWSPTCPHCAAVLGEIKDWENTLTNGDPGMILISDGDVDEHKSLGLKSPVIIDKGYKTAAKFGMFGTPSAVLVDENGIISTETGVGAKNIWALLGKKMNGTN